jgi:hypothetical protein
MDAVPDRVIHDLRQSYHIGQNCVVQWLAETARKHCQLQPSLSLVIQPALNERPLKAKKKKKSHAADQHSPQEQTTVSTDTLIALAKSLAETCNPIKPAPPGIEDAIRVLASVIRGRRERALFLGIDTSLRSCLLWPAI